MTEAEQFAECDRAEGPTMLVFSDAAIANRYQQHRAEMGYSGLIAQVEDARGDRRYISAHLCSRVIVNPPTLAFGQATRLVVVDHRGTVGEGRILDASNVAIGLDIQDGGRTLKVFVRDDPRPVREGGQ